LPGENVLINDLEFFRIEGDSGNISQKKQMGNPKELRVDK